MNFKWIAIDWNKRQTAGIFTSLRAARKYAEEAPEYGMDIRVYNIDKLYADNCMTPNGAWLKKDPTFGIGYFAIDPFSGKFTPYNFPASFKWTYDD